MSNDLSQSNSPEFVKLNEDLKTVLDKARLCREMLQVSPGIAQDDALAEVVGFLEVCRDRLVDVIEAGTSGLLGEELFAQVLKTNDTVLKTLDAERNGTKIPIDDDVSVKGAAIISSLIWVIIMITT